MSVDLAADLARYPTNIRQAGLTIHDFIEVGDPQLWIPTPDLERLLDACLRGVSLAGCPPKTRSKLAKEHVCRALGYPVPTSFPKRQPRFTGQLFDTYVQAANNLQVWNEGLTPTRRYVLIRPSVDGVIVRVKVVSGDVLARLKTTGRHTHKYQARCIAGAQAGQLVSAEDTALLRPLTEHKAVWQPTVSPVDQPAADALLPISTLYERLMPLIGTTLVDTGHGQDRNRGAGLHRLVCATLGYAHYRDNGQFPDVRHQLLEVKLQTAATIDLGLVLPSSEALLDVPELARRKVRHCDVRYAIFCGHTNGAHVTLTHLVLTTGEAFFSRFPQFQGKGQNKKLQIRLPGDFFGSAAEGLPD